MCGYMYTCIYIYVYYIHNLTQGASNAGENDNDVESQVLQG